MTAPALIIMAAGIGSRYGGLKQVDPIGPSGEIIIDYSVFDALRAGFGKVVFLIRKEIEDIFREKIGQKVENRVETVYVYQELADLPPGFSVPPDRKKPWGTAHAVLSCRAVVDQPFAVINADDYYGAGAFQVLADYLRQAHDQPGLYDYCMVGYTLRNTLSEFGSVARGICEISPAGYLQAVHERTHIVKAGSDAKFTEDGEHYHDLSGDATVSMNMFGFTPSFFDELALRFPRFLEKNAGNLQKAEFFLPDVVNALLQENRAQVKVLPTGEKWFGVTNPEDRAYVQGALRQLVSQGVYPESLWNGEHTNA